LNAVTVEFGSRAAEHHHEECSSTMTSIMRKTGARARNDALEKTTEVYTLPVSKAYAFLSLRTGTLQMLRILTSGGICPGDTKSRSSYRVRPAAATLSAFWESLHEGLAAHRQYEHLKSTGMQHGAAIRTAFGMHSAPAARPRAAEQQQKPVETLLCAGTT
jgi:hypothetical protein